MSKGLNKAARLIEMERLYWQRAYSDIEMGERLGVSRQTVFRDRVELSDGQNAVPIIQDEQGKWKIDRVGYLSNVRVNLFESLSLYLAARRASQQSQLAGEYAANALEKLAVTLRQPMTSRLVKAADKVLATQINPSRVRIFETVARGWAEQVNVRIHYQALRAEMAREHLIQPYLIEPSPWSDSVYVIAHSNLVNDIVPFKIERIERASLSTGQFDLPEGFNEDELLKHAWGIWRKEGEPEIVKLRFSPGPAARRLTESIWHPLEEITELGDGGYLWQAPIAEPREMLPWIRGWGADVEVLEPEKLRQHLIHTVEQLGEIYKVQPSAERQPYQWLYAKTNPDDREAIHLLLYHLIDVGQVAQVIWDEVLTNGIRQQLAATLNLSTEDCGRFLAFLAALHDLGKASPAYQRKYAPDWLKKKLEEAALKFEKSGVNKIYDPATPHGWVTTWALEKLLPEMLGLEARFAKRIATALGGHHGIWPSNMQRLDDGKHPAWETTRQELLWQVQGTFNPPSGVAAPKDIVELNTFLTILSGLASVADWIGSRNKERFGFIQKTIPSRQYVQEARQHAHDELTALKWIGWQPDGERQAFANVFAYLNFTAPRVTQQAVIEKALDLALPTLLILEAPTGLGKTETALYLADCWLQTHQGRGLYIAMPTTATSNQMYTRVGQFLAERYPGEQINYHLVHGQAAWADDLKKQVELQSVGDDAEAHISAESWFNPRKRTLLAPFGVGTVDQTLMSILQTKHFFVRLFGLAHKVVIFDEVHAYDTYMNTLFHRLLTWLNAIGTSVIILSATLPAKTRREMVEAYTGKTLNATEPTYPALTLANAAHQETLPLPFPIDENYTLELDWAVGDEPEAIAAFLETEMANGGCAAVICNTVRRAQDVYRAIQDANIVPADDLILFHSRFPAIWRKGIEARVLDKFGKGGSRPQKAIVVATQVIEQSLDIDFDLMVTDLAPVDLILQRAGRLHRHQDNERYGLGRRLMILEPNIDEDGFPVFKVDKFYGEYILLRSYLALQGTSEIKLPKDTINLIENVYDDAKVLDFPNEKWPEKLQEKRLKMDTKQSESQIKAETGLVFLPKERGLLNQKIRDLDEDNPEVHASIRAQTRDIDFSITVICLHQSGNLVSIYAEGGGCIEFSLDEKLPAGISKTLLQNAISIQHKGIGKYFVEQATLSEWKNETALRYCRYAIFKNGICEQVPGYTLKLTAKYGLETIKHEKKQTNKEPL